MSVATFEANPNPNENDPWIERRALENLPFRIWHLMFFSLCAFGILVVLICCCVKIRVPRTKQEIEGDYKRKKIASKFRKKLKIISNQDMEAMDLRKALEIIIEADYKDQQKTPVAVDEREKLVPSTQLQSTFEKNVANVIKMGKFSMSRTNMN